MALTNGTYCCDFCGEELERNHLYLICSGLSDVYRGWKEIVCENCKTHELGVKAVPLSLMVA